MEISLEVILWGVRPAPLLVDVVWLLHTLSKRVAPLYANERLYGVLTSTLSS